jgi:PTH1 family peptidyl-tRNA hydrolase
LGSCDFNGEKILLCEPLTYVNLSGEAIKKIMDYYKIEIKDLLVIVDDVNLDLGRIRIRQSGSAGGHNGLKNIINYLGEEFYRVRVGVGKNSQIILSDYVLSKFSAEELSIINPALNECGIIMEEFMAGLTIEKIMLNHNK